MPQIREQIAMVHLPPSKTLKYLFHVRKTKMERRARQRAAFYFLSPSARETNPLGSESLRADQKWSVVRVSVRRSIFYPCPPGRQSSRVLNTDRRTNNTSRQAYW